MKSEDQLIYFGEKVKALDENRIGGYLVRFSDPDTGVDLENDFFTKNTEFGVMDGGTLPVFYNHGMDSNFRAKRIGHGLVKYDEVGLWFEAQLEMRDEYEKMVMQLAKDGKLGWSSGAAGHLVEEKAVGKFNEIKTWIIGEASLTPTPAEPRNRVVSLKSLLTPDAVHNGDKKDKPVETKESTMESEELLSAIDEKLKAFSTETAEKAAELAAAQADETVKESLKAFESKLPDVKAGNFITDVKDEADKQEDEDPLEGAEFFREVKAAANGIQSKRLKAYVSKAALGLQESVPSDGGFLVPPATRKQMFERMYDVGQILSRVQRDPVAGNSMTIPAIDETSRVDGSRFGGVRGYWLDEAGTKTSSKPKFREIDLKLKKVAALVYATDEQLEDVSFMNSWLNRVVPDELRFKVEDAIYNGNGVGKPLGWMSSAAKVEVTRLNASEINFEDIVAMWARRWAGVNDYIWYVNQDTSPQLDQLYLTAGTAGIPPRFIDYDATGIMRMKGRPVIEVEYAQTLGTAGDILLVSPSQYQLIDKASGIQAAQSIHVQFTTDETAFRFVYRVDGEPLWNSALTPFKGSNTQTPIVALSASS